MANWSDITIWYVVGNLLLMFFYTIVTAIGGGFDLVYFFKELKKKKVDVFDDGRVFETLHDCKDNKSKSS
ncbi:MAG: hypothetical protein ABIG61_07970 [Planctomycetota bacterium]